MLVQHSLWFRFYRPLHTLQKGLVYNRPDNKPIDNLFSLSLLKRPQQRTEQSIVLLYESVRNYKYVNEKPDDTYVDDNGKPWNGRSHFHWNLHRINFWKVFSQSFIEYSMRIYPYTYFQLEMLLQTVCSGVSVQYWPMLLPLMLKANVISATWQQDTSIGWLDTSIGCNISYPYCKRRALRVQRLLFAF